jgi:hypothetical protein
MGFLYRWSLSAVSTPSSLITGSRRLDKADLEDEREVGSGEGEKMAAMWGCNYHETSAVCPPSLSK